MMMPCVLCVSVSVTIDLSCTALERVSDVGIVEICLINQSSELAGINFV